MASETNITGTAADDATIGTEVWNNPTNAQADDTSFTNARVYDVFA